MEKTVIVALIGLFASVGTVEIAGQADDVLQEATVVAAAHQERELRNALELYYLQEGSYPAATNDQVVDVLYRADLLRGDDTPFTIMYTGFDQDYNLSVR